tara:strand:- start:6593 stop:7144 length:552 start_codon:yes stop_codon:yes gene_type:complete
MIKETDVDCMKYRKSSHLAGVDVEAICEEKGECILTIKEAYYSPDAVVNGKTNKGYYLEFAEDVKPMVVNSGNRKEIHKLVKAKYKCSSSDSRKVSSWIGLAIELWFDPTVKYGKEVTGGIKVRSKAVVARAEAKADEAKVLASLEKCDTLEDLKAAWSVLTSAEKKLPKVVKEKQSLKTLLL